MRRAHPLPADLAEWAGIYRSMAAAYQFTPAQVDEMFLWEIAELLGVNDPAPDVSAPAEAVTAEEFERTSRELIKRRLAAARADTAATPGRDRIGK